MSTSEPPPADTLTFLNSVPLEEQLGPRGELVHVKNSRGASLACCFFPAPVLPAKGIVYVIHGHGSYLGHEILKAPSPGAVPVYAGSWVEKINAAGYSVCGLDSMGSGRSTGLRAYCNAFDDYVDDALLLVEKSTGLGLGGFEAARPKFLQATSLGGAIALHAAMRRPDLFAGVVMMAPMLSLEKMGQKLVNRILRPFAALLNALSPTLAIVDAEKNAMHPEIQCLFESDPACYHGKTRVRSAYEYLRVTESLWGGGGAPPGGGRMAEVTVPFLIFHSENDTMCDVDGSKRCLEMASSKDKTLTLVNDMWHVLSKEPGSDDILQQILAWYGGRVNPKP